MKNSILVLFISALLIGCGGSSSSNESPVSSSPVASSSESRQSSSFSDSSLSISSTSTSSDPASILTGVLLDSAVVNAGYQTPTLAGFTNQNGEFQYREGELIGFYIGAMQFPKVPGAEIITMLDFSNPHNINHRMVINVIRLLQSLDSDGNPDNGIQLSEAAINTARQLDLDVEPRIFEQSPDLLAWLSEAGGPHKSLISIEQAQAHFQKTLDFVYGSSSSSSSLTASSRPASSSSARAISSRSSVSTSVTSSSDDGASSSDGGAASSESSSSIVSSDASSEASSSSAPAACNYETDVDCDGIPNPLDTTFSCNIDGSTSNVFSQVLSSEAFAENNSLLPGEALNPSNVLIQGEGSSSDLVIALTGAAGVRVVNSSGVWEGAVSQPGKIGVYFSAPSSLLTANILGGLQLLIDGVEVATTGSTLLQVDVLSSNTNYVWLVDKPDVDFTSVTFRARSVIGLATFDYRKLCIEQPFPGGGGASSASSDDGTASSDDGAASSDDGASSSDDGAGESSAASSEDDSGVSSSDDGTASSDDGTASSASSDDGASSSDNGTASSASSDDGASSSDDGTVSSASSDDGASSSDDGASSSDDGTASSDDGGGTASSEASSDDASSDATSSDDTSSEAASSSAPAACNYETDFDCDGIPNPLDTTFSCNIDGSTSYPFSQVLSSEAFAENNSLLLGTALNPSNVLIQGEGSSSDLVIALTGAAGVRVVNSSGVWEGAVSQPGKIGVYFSAPSSLLPANILGGLQLLVDGVEVPTTGSTLLQVDVLGGNTNYVWLVDKPDVDFTSVTFRARSVIGLATFDYRKLCIEQPFPSGGGASSASSASSSSAAPACAIDDADCDGISDAVDSTFSCRGDGTPEGALSSFRQLLVSDVAGITTWHSGLSTAANISNLLAPGDGNFATLSVVLTGAAGVDMALEASQPSGLTSPGRVAFVVSENSPLLPQELLGGVGIQFDNIATEYAPTLVSDSLNLDAPTGYAMTVISVQKPDSNYQSIRFRQGSVLGVSPTVRLHKVCIEEL